MKTFDEIYQHIYASWLAKNIGIRLGAPIEAWTGPQVRKLYQPITNYLTDYGVFAADDDANGPLFFAKAIEDKTIDQLTVDDFANNLLNVVPHEKGFFWWGGKGISTEHTAWLNLISGIPAPQSGSIKQNTKAIAEQIGGQIFSDCWGYVALDNPQLACKLAKMMSSVTHDGDGIEGGKFVAVCISLAWKYKDCNQLIQAALQYLNPTSSYVTTVQDILNFHQQYPTDSNRCLAYIEDKYSYDNFEGLCHILPNTAIMIYGMLYGDNHFDKTMQLIAEAGRDTDCNLGNVASIMGMMLGLDGIDDKWITPINDILLCSSSIGSINITTISNSAYHFSILACKLNQLPYPIYQNGIHTTHFYLPYSTNGFIVDHNRYHACNLRVNQHNLQVCMDNVLENQEFKVYKHSYFLPEEVYDYRYEPEFSSTLEPNDKLEVIIDNPQQLNLEYALFTQGYSGKIYQSEYSSASTLTFQPNADDIPYRTYGILVKAKTRIQHAYFNIKQLTVYKQPQYEIDFCKLHTEDWGLDFNLNQIHAISGLRFHRGNANITNNEFRLQPHSAFNFSGPDTLTHKLSLEIHPTKNIHLHLCYRWNGCYDYQSIEIDNHHIYICTCNQHSIQRVPITNTNQEIFLIEIEIDIDKQLLKLNQDSYPIKAETKPSSVGICNQSDEEISLIKCRIEAKHA